jgi:cobalt-zinc-cadmium efflux system outer membrane protein
VAVAIQEVVRVENDRAERVAIALRSYSSARTLAERYRTDILPKAEQAYKLSLDAFKGGQFENYLRVIQAQRGVAEARRGRVVRPRSEETWPNVPQRVAVPKK